MMKGKNTGLVILGVIAMLVIICVVWCISVNNSAITKEENLMEAKIAIGNAETLREQKIKALVDGLQEYEDTEQEMVSRILESIDAAMDSGDYNEVNTQVNALFALPTIQSVTLYEQLGNTYAIEANRFSGYYEDYNMKVASYNAFFRKFPNKMFLSIGGTEKLEFAMYDLTELVDVDIDLSNIHG
jgi:hypothetical protein